MKKALSSRERVKLALEHTTTDRIPIANLCGGINPKEEFNAFLKDKIGIGIEQYLAPLIDTKDLWSNTGLHSTVSPGTDIWGIKRKAIKFGGGSYDEIEYYPLASAQTVSDIQNYAWPSTQMFDYNAFALEINKIDPHHESCIVLGIANPFETSWYMRGLEQIYMDFLIAPDIVHAIMENVTSFYLNHFNKILARCNGSIDIVFTADDIAGQTGLLLNLDMWREFIKPYHVRLNEMIHDFGLKVAYHSDGNVMDAIRELMDMGIDILQALQLNAQGMDPQVMKEKYGHTLCFEGGMCIQKIMPFGSSSDVENETKKLIDILGKNGGYLLGPSHYIQAETPPENIFTFFETAKNYYPF